MSLYILRIRNFNLGTGAFPKAAVERRDRLAKRDLMNCSDLTIPTPIHQDEGVNRNRDAEPTLRPREIL
jgi:hypothetical protein